MDLLRNVSADVLSMKAIMYAVTDTAFAMLEPMVFGIGQQSLNLAIRRGAASGLKAALHDSVRKSY